MSKPKVKRAKLVDDDTVEIWFPFDWDTLEVVKSVPGREFHDDDKGKYWTCPLSVDAVEILGEDGFQLDPALRDYIDKATVNMDELEGVDVPELQKDLYPFQREGVAFFEERDGNVLLADEMGLGKTIQSLAWLYLHPELRPAIVVCPSHLKYNWKRELEETFPADHGERVQVLSGRDTDQPLYGDIIILNYSILHNKYESYKDSIGRKRKREITRTGWVDYILDLEPKALVIDEVHYCKNNPALRTKSTKKLAREVPHVAALTGTPIVNRPREIFNALKMVDDTVFPDFWHFVHRYCDAHHDGYGWNFDGATNKKELHQKLTSTLMLRRRKKNVLTELPDKTYSYIPIEIDNWGEYREAELNFLRFVRKRKGSQAATRARRAEHLARIEALKQLAVRGKMDWAVRWIRDFLDDNGKLVVFAVHKGVVDRLMNEFGDRAVKVDGSVSAKNRDRAVDSFQTDPSVRLFVGNIQAAGTGITLTAASSVAFLELPWTPGEVSQASDRVHRIGQENAVNIYYLLADDTIEYKIAELLDEKRVVLDAVLDGQEVEETELLTELMRSYEEDSQ